MKKSVKEQLEKHAVTPYPHKGWQSEFVVPVSVAMRIIRRACKESYAKGCEDAHNMYEDKWHRTAKESVDEVINGPKKARGR